MSKRKSTLPSWLEEIDKRAQLADAEASKVRRAEAAEQQRREGMARLLWKFQTLLGVDEWVAHIGSVEGLLREKLARGEELTDERWDAMFPSLPQEVRDRHAAYRGRFQTVLNELAARLRAEGCGYVMSDADPGNSYQYSIAAEMMRAMLDDGKVDETALDYATTRRRYIGTLTRLHLLLSTNWSQFLNPPPPPQAVQPADPPVKKVTTIQRTAQLTNKPATMTGPRDECGPLTNPIWATIHGLSTEIMLGRLRSGELGARADSPGNRKTRWFIPRDKLTKDQQIDADAQVSRQTATALRAVKKTNERKRKPRPCAD